MRLFGAARVVRVVLQRWLGGRRLLSWGVCWHVILGRIELDDEQSADVWLIDAEHRLVLREAVADDELLRERRATVRTRGVRTPKRVTCGPLPAVVKL